ncbi:MAG: endonuclease/exonuclease/phosphatase family protein [Cyanobacteria bacterium P01_H01_bin.119]
MKIKLKWIALAIALPVALVAAFFGWASSGSFPRDRYAETLTFGENPSVPETPDTFTVVSYNIGYLSGLTNNVAVARERALFERNQATAIAALSELEADFIGFQEIDFDAWRSFQMNQLRAIAAELGLNYGATAINWDKNYVPFPYWPPTAHFGKVLSGQAVLSRFPVTANERIVLEKVPDNPFFYNALYLDRVAQVSQIAIGDQTLVVINVHLEAFDNATRQRQTAAVRELAESYAADYPVLLIGDFNSALNRAAEGDRSINILLESAQLQVATSPALLEAPEQATFPSDQPEFKLDYLFYTPDTIELVNTNVVSAAAQASDHLPLAMTFRLIP